MDHSVISSLRVAIAPAAAAVKRLHCRLQPYSIEQHAIEESIDPQCRVRLRARVRAEGGHFEYTL